MSSLPLETIPAVAYVRMSTEHQQYSTSNQLDRIKEYAARRGMHILKIYADEGKSGLNVKGRESLQRMIEDVTEGRAEFKAILAYDISRWGRFQDADESGYYEYICKRAGIGVHYCAEQFENDGSPASNIIKSVKRSMAGEYSRELSTKVFQGACRLVQLGFRQGGAAGFGLRRMLVDEHRNHKQVLAIGEHKSLQTDRVVLVPGPPEEQAIVLGMYRSFVEEGKSERAIGDRLNAEGVRTDFGRAWTRGTVHEVLTNEKYLGHNVYHRTSFKLKRLHTVNPPDMWIRNEKAFEAIVPTELFWRAQGIIEARSRRYSDEDMLTKLKSLLEKHGRISGMLIDEHDDMPSSSAYRTRFGSLPRAYQMIGYCPEVDLAYIEINRLLRKKHPELIQQTVRGLEAIGASVTTDPDTDVLLVNGEYRAAIVLSRCLQTEAGAKRWCVRFEHGHHVDITIAARMNEDHQSIRDFYLLPVIDIISPRIRLSEDNGIMLDAYRFDDLNAFFSLAERVRVESVA
ncbi:MAG: recombinase family protein [Verrucomicrobia bacterium]|nr:recombinase family protein [Verrucomicrobiota bacterium]